MFSILTLRHGLGFKHNTIAQKPSKIFMNTYLDFMLGFTSINQDVKFKDYKNCQEANWFENKINYLEKKNE